MSPQTAAVFGSIPRRAPLQESIHHVPLIWHAPAQLPAVGPGRALLHGLKWLAAVLRFIVFLLWDRLRGQSSHARIGRHMRDGFQSMGGMAVKLGQQLSVRSDLLPFELCQELIQLTDKVKPFPREQAVRIIEQQLGAPMSSVFKSFDPEPIGSASMACVYLARLHDDTRVAVKVQRPGIAHSFAADLLSITVLTQAMELLTVVRPAFFRGLRQELRAMFLEELDFRIEARYQSLFRTFSKRDRLDWLKSPTLYRQWCGRHVIVMEYVEGIPCTEVLTTLDIGQSQNLATLKAMNIDPQRCSERLFILNNWSRFEVPFFHADPHPANILILPGSEICMIDFGSCGTNAFRASRCTLEMLEGSRDADAETMSQAGMLMVMPLPQFEHRDFRHRFELVHTQNLIRWQDPHNNWFERTSALLWLSFMDTAREYQIPLNLDTLRIFRGSLLYDTLVARLNREGLSAPEDYQTLANSYLKKYRRRLLKRVRRAARVRPDSAISVREALDDLTLLLLQLEKVSAEARAARAAALSAISLLLRLLLPGAALAVLLLVILRPEAAHLSSSSYTPHGLAASALLLLVTLRIRHALQKVST